MKRKNIGFLSYWGWSRGMAYVTLCYAKMIKDDHNVFILKQGINETLPEFNIGINVEEHDSKNITAKIFSDWLTKNKIDIVIFNEYNQWTKDPNELIQVAKKFGVKTFGYLVMERFEPKQVYEYDRIICPTKSVCRVMRQHKIRHFSYVPFSIDLTEFPNDTERNVNKKFTFFHPGGWGGVYNRKNTEIVIEAFEQLDDDNTELIITSLKPLQFNRELRSNIKIINKDLSRKELLEQYFRSDMIVLPSKWETVGLPIVEALASSKPVITTDVPPMNEFITNQENGYLCSNTLVKYNGISVYGAEVSPNDLKKVMVNAMNKDVINFLGRNARNNVEKLYNLEKNKKYLLELIG